MAEDSLKHKYLSFKSGHLNDCFDIYGNFKFVFCYMKITFKTLSIGKKSFRFLYYDFFYNCSNYLFVVY